MEIIFSGYGEFNRRRPIGPAQWPHFDLLFIHEGEVSVSIKNGAPIQLARGEAVLIRPHTPFQGRSKSHSSRASVHHFIFHPGESISWVATKFHGQQSYIRLDSRGDRQVQQDLDRSLRLPAHLDARAAHDMQCQLLCLALTQLLFNRAQITHADKRDREFLALLNWLASNLDRPVSIAEMAGRTHLSESHFRKLFRRKLGTSPGAYIQDLRMLEARRLLRESTLPVKAIAARTGFKDLSHFYRAFAKQASLPPAKYRRKYSPTG